MTNGTLRATRGQIRNGYSRRGLAVVTLVALAAFGPYVTGGVRTEQIAVYSIAAVLLVLTAPLLRPSGPLVGVVLAWLSYTSAAVLGVLDPPRVEVVWPSGSTFAGLDNLITPLAVVTVALGLLALGAQRELLLRRAAATTVLMMCANTVAAIMQSRGVEWTAWWATDADSVAMRAGLQGRFSGLLNQPAEAGILYGVALLAAAYLLADRPGRLLLVSTALLYGGALTVSKVFLLVALPVFLWQLLRFREHRAIRLALALCALIGAVLLASLGWLPEWAGADQARLLLPGQGAGSLLDVVTAGRLGERSTLEPVFRAVYASSPWLGYGAAGLAVPYDNGWLEAMVLAGILGVVCYTLVFIIGWRAWRGMSQSRERSLLGSLLVLLAGASVGVPALTANRAAPIVWLFLALLLSRTERGDVQGAGLVAVSDAHVTSTTEADST